MYVRQEAGDLVSLAGGEGVLGVAKILAAEHLGCGGLTWITEVIIKNIVLHIGIVFKTIFSPCLFYY